MFSPTVGGLFVLAWVSGTLMGISQKYLSTYSPYLVNMVAQGVAMCVFGLLWYMSGHIKSFGGVHWAMGVLGLAFVGLNYGYSALYGQGVMLAYVPILVTGGMTILLGIVGWLWFGEQISWQFLIGSLMILAGMGVMVMK